MTRAEENHASVVDDRTLDRLVDGELNEAERRLLLGQLESDPQGWRRCALAFLEAQAFREAFGPLAANETDSEARLQTPCDPGALTPKPASAAKPRRARLALAASLLAAFMAGFAGGGATAWRASPTPGNSIVSRPTARPAQPAPKGTSAKPRPVPPAADPAASARFAAANRATGASEAVVPVLAGRSLNDLLRRQESQELPLALVRQWERQGYQLETHRRLISMDLKGGQRLAIPVDEIRLRYVGQRAY